MKEYTIHFTTTVKGVKSNCRRVVWANSETEARSQFLLWARHGSYSVKIREIKEHTPR